MVVWVQSVIPSGTIPAPSWPNAGNTGVPPGVVLTTYSGPMTISTPGTVIDGQIINGTLTVTASDVTIQNCVIQNFSFWGILGQTSTGASPENTRVRYCEISDYPSTQTSGFGMGGGANSIIANCKIHGMTIGIQLFGTCRVTNNFIYDLSESSTDPNARHFDGITVFGGNDGTVIYHNAITVPEGTATVFIKTQNGDVGGPNGVIVRENMLLGTPSYNVYSEQTSSNTITGVQFVGNVMSRGQFGYGNVVNNTVVWSNNIDATTGAAIPTP